MYKPIPLLIIFSAIFLLPPASFSQSFFNFGKSQTAQTPSTIVQNTPSVLNPISSPQDYKTSVAQLHQQNQQMLTSQLNGQLSSPPPPTQQITPPPSPNTPQAVEANPPPSTQAQSPTPILNNSNTTGSVPATTPPPADNQPLQSTTPPSSVLVTPSIPSNQSDVYNGYTTPNTNNTAPATTNQTKPSWNIHY